MIGQAADSITKGYCYAVVVLCSALSFNTEKILISLNKRKQYLSFEFMGNA